MNKLVNYDLFAKSWCKEKSERKSANYCTTEIFQQKNLTGYFLDLFHSASFARIMYSLWSKKNIIIHQNKNEK